MFQNQVTNATEALLSLRANDDFRIAFLKDVMFSDDIGGLCENRTFVGIAKDGSNEILPKAKLGDTMTYMMVPDTKTIRMSIENNIRNIQTMMSMGKIAKDTVTWVLLFENTENGEIISSVYRQPTAADCDEIIKGDKEVAACFFVSLYKMPTAEGEEPLIVADWSMISPADERNIDEYNTQLIEAECAVLRNMFMLNFENKFNENRDAIIASVFAKNAGK